MFSSVFYFSLSFETVLSDLSVAASFLPSPPSAGSVLSHPSQSVWVGSSESIVVSAFVLGRGPTWSSCFYDLSVKVSHFDKIPELRHAFSSLSVPEEETSLTPVPSGKGRSPKTPALLHWTEPGPVCEAGADGEKKCGRSRVRCLASLGQACGLRGVLSFTQRLGAGHSCSLAFTFSTRGERFSVEDIVTHC